jgi:ABC-2 type transport system ATP-binding protein
VAIANPPAVSVEGLDFRYPGSDGSLLTDLNLTISKGDSFGLFGPNGAGKTTLMNLMTGVLNANAGDVKILGHPMGTPSKKVNRLFGFVPQDFSFYDELSAVENLEFYGAWAGLDSKRIKKRTAELLHILGLGDVKKRPVGKFSGGMKRRINLAIGVIHNPSVLFLDEPTVGVDVQTRHAIISYLKELNDNGTTLIYTSHQLSEAEALCRNIALIDIGKIVAEGTLDELNKKYKKKNLEELFLSLTGKDFRD